MPSRQRPVEPTAAEFTAGCALLTHAQQAEEAGSEATLTGMHRGRETFVRDVGSRVLTELEH